MADGRSESTPADRDPGPQRADRLEESVAFLDHHLEQVGKEVAALGRTVHDLARRVARLEAAGPAGPGSDSSAPGLAQPVETLAALERRTIVEALARAGDSRERAAQELGIDLATLQRKLLHHGLA